MRIILDDLASEEYKDRGVDKVRPVLKKGIEFHFSSLYSVTDIEFNGER